MASESAQGHETTSRAKVTASARDASICHQTSAVTSASASSAATNQAATRSARRATRGRASDACSTRRSTDASRVASPAAVTRTTSAPSRLTAPASTASPGRFARGQLSPVRTASSTCECPSATTPSAGTVAPGRTSTCSPLSSAAAATVSTCSPPGQRRHPLGDGGPRTRDPLDRLARLVPRRELDIARDQQQRDEHRDRVVVDRTAADERRPGARGEGRAQPQCHAAHPCRAGASRGRATRRGRRAAPRRTAQAASA